MDTDGVAPQTPMCYLNHLTLEEEEECDARSLASQQKSDGVRKKHVVSFTVESEEDWVPFVGNRKMLGVGLVNVLVPEDANIKTTELPVPEAPVLDGLYVGASVLGTHVVRLLSKRDGQWRVQQDSGWAKTSDHDNNVRCGDLHRLEE